VISERLTQFFLPVKPGWVPFPVKPRGFPGEDFDLRGITTSSHKKTMKSLEKSANQVGNNVAYNLKKIYET